MTLLLVAALLAAPAHSPAGVMHAYVSRWLAGDERGVMALLTPDSVLVPGEKRAIVGAEAIRGYWFPAAGPATKLTRFETTIDRVETSGDLAVLRGTQAIEWLSGGERWRTAGNYVAVLRRAGGEWRITMQVAANGANERSEEQKAGRPN